LGKKENSQFKNICSKNAENRKTRHEENRYKERRKESGPGG